MVQLSSIFNISCGASVLMAFYIGAAGFNLYRLMYPLGGFDASDYDLSKLVNPLWTTNPSEEMHLRVYVSTGAKFQNKFLSDEFWSDEDEERNEPNGPYNPTKPTERPTDSALLWEEEVSSPAFSKSFLLTSADCSVKDSNCRPDEQESFDYAKNWLDKSDELAIERGEGGVIAALKAAGQGVESTSVLLNLYQSITKQIRKLLIVLKMIPGSLDEEEDVFAKRDLASILDRKTIDFSGESKIWNALRYNSTIHIHVLLVRKDKASGIEWPPTTASTAMKSLRQFASANSVLTGGTGMVKYDLPHHVHKPRRILFQDILYVWRKYVGGSREMPPWVMEISKPEETMRYKQAMEMKARKQPYPYFKPEVSIKYVNEVDSYPYELAGASGMPVVRTRHSAQHPTGLAFIPAIHVDEIGLTIDKYIALNETITSLPLRISFDRSDMEHTSRATTATAGGMSPARWRLLSHLSEALQRQQDIGFDQSDIDEVRSLIADTNVTLLLITLLASSLHLLFEFLTFKNEVTFWQNNKDLTGLSVRALFMDMFGQTVIVFFLIEKESSLLITIPAAIGCLIALWKCRKAAGLKYVMVQPGEARPVAWYNWIPRMLFGYELRATRLETQKQESSQSEPKGRATEESGDKQGVDLSALTIESDRLATQTIGATLLPVVVVYTIYSLCYEEHKGWLSWLVTSASSGVYAFGFVMMTPQLFLNWKMKSVAHLPWRVLCYKFLNTFIDDLFSFIVRMPTMARLSCFRDDVVFFIYLYQRWLYPVDTSRPAEGFSESPEQEEGKALTDKPAIEKKNQ
mmetsp:Transcript_13709/g.37915  ORF Transcript_13709/g.37915 Transcript_13709/m.37915 type:complete len:802 (-) Transcript_13709:61-2466(-)|eukprot:CAMPEP_0168747986 /NCGR_PEP_ID=MMETSP0724-20121128/15942_1 /TAXON_ID=265536 /ORGANISM="Amphiprora sp., Strain CCMP467" /LENGTH=801 /DNA_ID=CAMNT_0008795799 /DNA_START=456 /DNA_END=2861 /DNA_ORIENTATION=-